MSEEKKYPQLIEDLIKELMSDVEYKIKRAYLEGVEHGLKSAQEIMKGKN